MSAMCYNRHFKIIWKQKMFSNFNFDKFFDVYRKLVAKSHNFKSTFNPLDFNRFLHRWRFLKEMIYLLFFSTALVTLAESDWTSFAWESPANDSKIEVRRSLLFMSFPLEVISARPTMADDIWFKQNQNQIALKCNVSK